MTRHITAIFHDHQAAAAAVRSLREHDFGERETSIISKPHKDTGRTLEKLDAELGGPSARAGAWVGGALGAALAGATGLLSVALIPATPLLMVGAAALGGAAGDVFGGLGASQEQLEDMKEALRRGAVLVLVHQETEGRTAEAADLLRRAQADSVRVSG
jgi:hypothetical protein